MEIVLLWFLSMAAMGNEINQQHTKIDHQHQQIQTMARQSELNQKWIKDLEIWVFDVDTQLQVLESIAIKQASAHSSFYAGQQVKNRKMREAIEAAVKEANDSQ
tara:strand:+ start:111 stop:422 length:312 start_codon:yes stop_codon:yes gene_type:complete